MSEREDWIAAYAAKLGVEPPTAEQFNDILEIAAAAAHGSEKTAAPIACWLAGITGRPLGELRKAAEEIEEARP
jgi:hypothetical protein